MIQVEEKVYEAMRDAIAKSQKALVTVFDDGIPTSVCADATTAAIHAITWLQEMQGASTLPTVKDTMRGETVIFDAPPPEILKAFRALEEDSRMRHAAARGSVFRMETSTIVLGLGEFAEPLAELGLALLRAETK